ncbi:hypothetical protein CQW23_01245 [Capsicum baccatum]|uniref:Pyrrolo-quinoline quinone repeat domain-containing protein n=1 Tax=Capsicum baccatum TaxID=33114 RepID=A0A2G2XN17_CAPBA|nr:hypothetical protein CQW23_01245 [Capsicum baccatum]
MTYTLPDNVGRLGGYSRAVIWERSPEINVTKGFTFDVDSGEIACATMLGGYCVFYFTCLIPKIPDCPPDPNLDADFRHVVMTAKKSTFAWALDRNTCHIVWVQCRHGFSPSLLRKQDRELGVRSTECRHRWDAKFTQNIVNADSVPFPLALSTQTTAGRGWVASDASTGDTLWTTANPSNDSPHGPVNIVNGILFAGSVPPNGPLHGFDANTGKILWSFNSGATVYGVHQLAMVVFNVGLGYSIDLAKFHPTWTSDAFTFCLLHWVK